MVIDQGGKEFQKWLLKERPNFVIYRVDDGLVVEYGGAATSGEMVEKIHEMEERPGQVKVFTAPKLQ